MGPIYRKKRYLRFVLDTLESGSSQLIVKQQSNNDAHGYVISISVVAVSHSWHPAIFMVYLHTGVGFGVARSDD